MGATTLLTLVEQHHMIPPHSTVFVGVSGGADSICLLHRLFTLQDALQFQLVALHFNHQLRGDESDRDEAFVRQFVSQHCPVPLIVGTAPVGALATAQKLGVEEMARQCRYDFFQRHAQEVTNSRIATAHTADDNGETVLLNLVRGAGLRGLSGIPPVRDNIIRPLLTTTRQEVEDYLQAHNLPHVEDSSNQDDTYTRNRIRHQVMPVLTQQNPRFLHNIAALTPLLREEDQLLQELSTAQLPPVETGVDWLSLSGEKLLAMPRPLALRGIGQLAQRLIPNLVLELRHRQDILSLCAPTASPSAQISLPQGLIVRREYHLLVFTTAAPGTVQEVLFPLPGEIQVGCYHISAVPAICDGQHTPWDFWLSGQLDAVTLRKRQQGDRLQRPNRPEKTLKSLMIDEKISRHLRDSLPVFCRDQEIFAVAGLGVSQHALPPLGSHGWHIRISPAQDHIQSPIADSI